MVHDVGIGGGAWSMGRPRPPGIAAASAVDVVATMAVNNNGNSRGKYYSAGDRISGRRGSGSGV